MKKGWKIFWIVMGSVSVIGLACIIIALAFGLTMNSVYQAVDDGIGIVSHDWDDADRVDIYAPEAPASPEAPDAPEAPASPEAPDAPSAPSMQNIRRLEMDIDVADVEILSSDGKEIIVESSGFTNKYRFINQQEGDKLVLKTEQSGGFSLGSIETPKVKVHIPLGMEFTEVDLSMDAGRLVADQLICTSLDLDVEAGEIIVSNFTTAELDMECEAGSIKATGDISREASLSCDVGRVELSAKGKMEDFNFKLATDVGSIRVGSERFSGLGKSKRIDNGTNRMIEAEVSVGEVVIDFH